MSVLDELKSLVGCMSPSELEDFKQSLVVKKAIKVKPRIVMKDVPRDWGKAYIRCKKAADADGYIYCKDCANFSLANHCHHVVALQADQPYPTSLEFCINYVPNWCDSCPYEHGSAACWGNEGCPYNQ